MNALEAAMTALVEATKVESGTPEKLIAITSLSQAYAQIAIAEELKAIREHMEKEKYIESLLRKE